MDLIFFWSIIQTEECLISIMSFLVLNFDSGIYLEMTGTHLKTFQNSAARSLDVLSKVKGWV